MGFCHGEILTGMDYGLFFFLSATTGLGLGDLNTVGIEDVTSITGMNSRGETSEATTSEVATFELVASTR